MQGKVASIVEEELKDVIDNLGFELYEVEYVKKQNGMNLTLFIVKKDGTNVDINDCELVHRTVDPLLDEINPTGDAPYYLNVSSLGLDRPIKTDKDFKRMLNKSLVVKTFVSVNGKKEFVGVLKNFDEKEICLIVENKEMKFLRNSLALVKEEISF